MTWLRVLASRLAVWIRQSDLDSELDEEMGFHLEMETDANLARGLSPDEARRAARLRLGGVEQVKDAVRATSGLRGLDHLLQDFQFALRTLRRSPGFSLSVVGTLALCIGLNATVLSALYTIVLRPLPFEDPDQLVQVFNIGRNNLADSGSSGSSWSQYVDFRDRADRFQGFALSRALTRVIRADASVMPVRGQEVSADFFEAFRVLPVLGRFFTPAEVDPGPGHVMVLTESEWENRYDADPDVLGTQVWVDDDIVHTIVGVAPRSVEALDADARFFIPFDSRRRTGRYGGGADLWLRLKDGVDIEASRSQLRTIETQWYENEASAGDRRHFEAVFERLELDLPHPLERAMTLVELAALFVLLLGCLNVVNLVLSRTNHLGHEFATRYAVGAGKFQLWRLLFAENTVLIALATMTGALLSWGAARLSEPFFQAVDPAAAPMAPEAPVLLAVGALAAMSAVLISLLRIELLWRSGLLDRSASRVASSGLFSRRFSDGLVVAQVAIAFTLLVGAGLLVRSFQNVLSVDPGFAATQVVTARLDRLRSFYSQPSDLTALRRDLLARLAALPGVNSVAASLSPPLLPYNPDSQRDFVVRGASNSGPRVLSIQFVSPGYFETMGIQMLEGRVFDAQDTYGRPGQSSPFVIDELLASRFLTADTAALGTEMYTDNKPPPSGEEWGRVVGVAERANLHGLERRDGAPVAYACLDDGRASGDFSVLVRTSRPSQGLMNEMQTALAEVDSRLTFSQMGTLQDTMDDMLLRREGITTLLGVFAGLALMLTTGGIYALLAYTVSQQRRDIGIRMALGASRRRLALSILQQGLVDTSIGLGLGLVGVAVLTQVLDSWLFDLSSYDPPTFLGALLLVVVAATMASLFPAIRASNVDPMREGALN